MRRPVRGPLLLVAALGSAAACGASDPPAAKSGFFPSTYTGAFVINAPLVKSAEVGRDKRTLTFRYAVPKDQAFVVTIRCDRGRWVEAIPAGRAGGPCKGAALSFTDNGCSGGKSTEEFRVVESQPNDWGVALYTGKRVESSSCH